MKGSGATPSSGDECVVHYTGRLLDGTVFDSSVTRGQPFKFQIGARRVITGWDLGVATMTAGERCYLTCSPENAYGEAGSPPTIPPNATLRFEVELLSFAPKPKPLYDQTATERIALAETQKSAGNAALTKGDLNAAIASYKDALTVCLPTLEQSPFHPPPFPQRPL